jgi:hypothetical protein
MTKESMYRFEDAITWVQKGGRARRRVWADVTEYTLTTPPLNRQRRWHIWLSDSSGIVNGWGGSVGGAADDDPIRNGMLYSATDADRVAADWELLD